MNGKEGDLWEANIPSFKPSHVRIKKANNELAWAKNHSLGIYTSRLRYKAMCENERVEEM